MKENEMIKNISYELYKEDWKKAHGITLEIEKNNIKDYFANLEESNVKYSYNDFLNEFGYNGELYAGYEEFCKNEYQDENYMKKLLNNERLINLYLSSEEILKSKNVIYAGVDESDEILCPDCKNCVARNEDLDADRPKYCPECGAKLYY